MPELVVPLQLPNKPEILPLQRKRRQPEIVSSLEKEPTILLSSGVDEETSTTTTSTTSVTLTTTIETTIDKTPSNKKNPEKLIK